MTSVVTILSVGPGAPEFLNEITKNVLLEQGTLFLRTKRHMLSSFLESRNIPYHTMDALYDTLDDFDSLSASIAETLWKTAGESGSVIYAVADAMTDSSVDALYRSRPVSGKIRNIPGFSYADYYLSACRGYFPTADIRICPASFFSGLSLDPSRPVLITEINNAITAGEIKTALSYYVDDEETVIFFDANGNPCPLPLYELDRQTFYDHLSAVAVPGRDKMDRKRKTLRDLMEIMDTLRSPSGCPWDHKQTHETLKPYLVEESWEVVDAINKGDPQHLAEELGDLLFQVAFHASIGSSFDEFTMGDIVSGITNKMIRRHPHVFSRENHQSSAFSEAEWDRIKQKEQGILSYTESLNAVSPALPSLCYAQKVIRKIQTASVSNEESSESFILSSLLNQIKKMQDTPFNERKNLLGKALFFCVALARQYGIDSEVELHEFVQKVIESFHSQENVGEKSPISTGTLDFQGFLSIL